MLRFGHQFKRLYSVFRINPEVEHALKTNTPVVALESTIITHGLPYPANIEMAQRVESIIRKEGCVPATMGYINGQAVVGCDSNDLQQMGDPNIPKMKVSRRDIPTVIARGIIGGTTIATTMDLCHRAGIDIFATGGLGGVSRPFDLMDVSADLEELSTTPVGVVCSGPKSILDVGRTLEYLETKGVMVSTYIDSYMMDEFIRSGKVKNKEEAMKLISMGETLDVQVPGFYVRGSGIPSPYVFENPGMAARLLYASKFQMELPAGQVFCVPAPKDVELDPKIIKKVIDESLEDADIRGVRGKQLTPFLLGRINKVTSGESVKCNVEFVKNNARMASNIAKSLCDIKGGKDDLRQPIILDPETESTITSKLKSEKVDTAVVGSVAVDVLCKTNSNTPYLEDSNPGMVTESIGGVGFNVALATQRESEKPVLFISTINKSDSGGQFITNNIEEVGLTNLGLVEPAEASNANTAKYVSIHKGDGELIVACADMNIIEKLEIGDISPLLNQYRPKEIIFDANISVNLMNDLIERGHSMSINLVFEPTSVVKCSRIANTALPVFPNTMIGLVTPTINELEALNTSFSEMGKFNDIDGWFNVLDAIAATSLRDRLDTASYSYPLVKEYLQRGVFQRAFQLLPYFPTLLIKDGSNGVTLIQINENIIEAHKVASKSSVSDWTILSSSAAGRNGLGITIEHFPAYSIDSDLITNVTGAGDALLGSIIGKCGGILPPFGSPERENTILTAQMSAIKALTS